MQIMSDKLLTPLAPPPAGDLVDQLGEQLLEDYGYVLRTAARISLRIVPPPDPPPMIPEIGS